MPAKNKASGLSITETTVLRAIEDARSRLTDEEVFTSPAYQRILDTLGRVITGRTKITVGARILWNPSDPNMTAYTDNREIVVNASHERIQKLESRPERHMCVLGVAGHEFAHCLFSDFTLKEKQYEIFMDGRFYPAEPSITPANRVGIEGMRTLLAKSRAARQYLAKIYARLDNVIEDAYIERSLVKLFPGDLKKGIDTCNRAFFGDGYLKTVKESEVKLGYIPEWSSLANAILHLLMMNEVDFGSAPAGILLEIKGRLEKLAPRLVRESKNANVLARKELALDIMLENWDFIEKQIECSGAQFDEPSADKMADALRDMLDNMLSGGGAEHEAGNQPQGGKPIRVFTEKPSQSRSGGEETLESQGQASAGAAGSNEADGQQAQADGVESDESGSDDESDQTDGANGDDGIGGESAPATSNQASESGGNNDDSSQNPAVSVNRNEQGAPGNIGETTNVVRIAGENANDSFSGDELKNALSEIERELAKGEGEKAINDLLVKTLRQNAREALAGDIRATNGHWKIAVKRDADAPPDGWRRYEMVWPELHYVSKRLQKELLEVLKKRRAGGKQTGLAYGRRVHSRSLHREDERYFQKNSLPSDTPRIAVVVVVDQSGSMSGRAKDTSGRNLFKDKIGAASNAALLLYDFCIALAFSVMVIGHTTQGQTCVVNSAACFQRVDASDRYRIAGMRPGGGNRDGTALGYALLELKKRPEETKLLFILSDGLPSAYGSNESGIQHLQEVVEDAKRSNIEVFAAALDEDLEAVKHIYGDRMFAFSDLARMPKTLLGVLRRYI